MLRVPDLKHDGDLAAAAALADEAWILQIATKTVSVSTVAFYGLFMDALCGLLCREDREPP